MIPSLKQFDFAIPDRVFIVPETLQPQSLVSTFLSYVFHDLPEYKYASALYFKYVAKLFTTKIKPVTFSEYFSSYKQRYQVLITYSNETTTTLFTKN